MHTRNWLTLAACLATATSLLAGCAPAAAPAPTPKAEAPKPSPKVETPAAKPAPTRSPQPPAPASTPKPATDQPRYGGSLAIPTTGDPLSLDVVQEVGYLVVNVLQSTYSGIIQSDPENPEEFIGDLAKSWEISKDGLTYTFRLQENVKFHDGTVLTSDDVKVSLDRQLDPPQGIRAPRRPEMQAIDKVETPDKNTVKLTLKYAFGPILTVLSSGYQVIYSKSFLDKKGNMTKDVMGTGPFKLKNYSQGVSLEHVKNPDYFIKGRPYLDSLTFYIIKDAGTRLAAFRTGRVKLTGPGESGLTPSEAETVKKEIANAQIVSYSGLQYGNITLNTAQKPWSDVRVRKAASLAIDRQNAVKVLAQGYGEIGSHFPGKWGIPRNELEKMPGWRQPKDADLAEAKKLLAEAGYPNGFTVKGLSRSEKINMEVSTYVSNELAKIGIKYELDVKETAVRTQLLNSGDYSAHAFHSAYIYPDPQNESRFWALPLRGAWGQNWARVDDKKIFELWDKQGRTVEPAERAKVVRELDLALIDYAARPVVYWRSAIIAMWPEVKGRGKLIGNYNFQKYQDVWLAK